MSYTINTKKSWSATNTELQIEFERWGVHDWETNYPRGARLEGMNQSEQDRTVTLRYNKNGKEIRLSMGRQARAVDNLRVLFLAIESMRLNEKRGIGEVLEAAYLQLGGGVIKKSPWEVLEVYPGSPLPVAEAAYKAKALKAHPDVAGGSEEAMKEITEAINLIREGKA